MGGGHHLSVALSWLSSPLGPGTRSSHDANGVTNHHHRLTSCTRFHVPGPVLRVRGCRLCAGPSATWKTSPHPTGGELKAQEDVSHSRRSASPAVPGSSGQAPTGWERGLCPQELSPTSQGRAGSEAGSQDCRGRRGLGAQQREQTLPIMCPRGNANPQPRGGAAPVRTTRTWSVAAPSAGEDGGQRGAATSGEAEPSRTSRTYPYPSSPPSCTQYLLQGLKSRVHRKTCTWPAGVAQWLSVDL